MRQLPPSLPPPLALSTHQIIRDPTDLAGPDLTSCQRALISSPIYMIRTATRLP